MQENNPETTIQKSSTNYIESISSSSFEAKLPDWIHFTFDKLQDCILWINSEAQILYANEATLQLLELDKEDILDKYLYDFDQHPEVSESRWKDFWQQILEKQTFSHKTYYPQKAKRLIPIMFHFHLTEWEGQNLGLIRLDKLLEEEIRIPVNLFKADNQQISQLWSILEDWKDAYQKLKEKYDALYMVHSRAELANQALREGFWEIDLSEDLKLTEHTPIWYSPQFARLLGYEPEEFPPILKTWIDKFHPDQRNRVIEMYENFIRGSAHNDVYDVEYMLLTKAGKYRWFNARAKLQRDKFGKPIREAGALADINLRKNTEKILIKKNSEIKVKHHELIKLSKELSEQKIKSDGLNNLKDRLLSIIAHDFRAPLNALDGMLTLLQEEMISEAELKFLSQSLLERVRVISNFLDNLLNWAKSQMEGATVNPNYWEIAPVIAAKVALYQTQAEQKKINLSWQVSSQLNGYADVNMIELVLRNLISNAIKFCNAEDKIIVQAEEIEENFIQIKVQDTGLGIPPEKLSKLFGSENISTRGTANEVGTGLGLLLCKDFVEKNGGKIWVESTVNQGSTFYFTIPEKP